MEAKAYRPGASDVKRLVLRFLSKWWIIVLAALAGALLGSGLNCLYRLMNDGGIVYTAEATMYVDYATDERDEAYAYFNDYTWLTILKTDEIMDRVLPLLEGKAAKLDKEAIGEMLDAHTPSDIRVLILTVTGGDAECCDNILKAYLQALSSFGEDRKEFLSITVMDTNPATADLQEDYLIHAAVLGLITGVILSTLFLLVYYSVDTSICVESDVRTVTDVPVLGYASADLELPTERRDLPDLAASGIALSEVLPQGGMDLYDKEVLLNLDFIFEKNPGKAVCYADADGDTIDYAAARSSLGTVVLVHYNRTHACTLEHVLGQLKAQGADVTGIIIAGADRRFLGRYFGRVSSQD